MLWTWIRQLLRCCCGGPRCTYRASLCEDCDYRADDDRVVYCDEFEPGDVIKDGEGRCWLVIDDSEYEGELLRGTLFEGTCSECCADDGACCDEDQVCFDGVTEDHCFENLNGVIWYADQTCADEDTICPGVCDCSHCPTSIAMDAFWTSDLHLDGATPAPGCPELAGPCTASGTIMLTKVTGTSCTYQNLGENIPFDCDPGGDYECTPPPNFINVGAQITCNSMTMQWEYSGDIEVTFGCNNVSIECFNGPYNACPASANLVPGTEAYSQGDCPPAKQLLGGGACGSGTWSAVFDFG